jgi:hypothetical protein
MAFTQIMILKFFQCMALLRFPVGNWRACIGGFAEGLYAVGFLYLYVRIKYV